MSELPKGWAATTLGKLAAWGSGGTPSRSEPSYYGGTIPWIKTGELGPRVVESAEETITEAGLANSSAKLFPAGSVAIAMYGATIGKTSILGIAATTNQACAVGIPHAEATSKEYLYHFLCSQKDAFIEAGKGGAQPNISQGVIKDWGIPLAPLPEQKRIADKLDSVLGRVEACRDRLDRLPALLKRFRQSVLAAATSGRLTEDWRAPHSKPARYPLTALPDLLAKDRAGLKTGPFGSLLNKSEHQEAGIDVIGIENIDNGHFVPGSKIKISRQKANELSGYDLQFGDIVISRSGTVGEICAIPRDAGELRFSTNIIRVSLDTKAVLPEYFVALFQGCPVVLHQVKEQCKGSTRMFLNQAIMKAIRYPIPSVDEQHEIVRRVKTLFAFADRLEARLATARKQAEQLTPALLAKAFRGELVPQDPSDEPASELLKRLATARAETPKAKRGRKVAP